MNSMASALDATPEILPGNRIIGSLVSFLILLTKVSISIWSDIVEPPTNIAAALHFSIVSMMSGNLFRGVLCESSRVKHRGPSDADLIRIFSVFPIFILNHFS